MQIYDSNGALANDRFAILLGELIQLTAVDGSGVLPGNTEASVKWTIVPTDDAAPREAASYVVSGWLSYREGNIDVSTPLTGVWITVHPQPELDLMYFWQRDVFSDDPWTEEIEPSQPFELAVMVNNKGAGDARNLRIESAQPQIIENEKSLLIDFKIIASEVAGQNMTPSLTVDFGSVGAGTIEIARWWMTSTLQGQFIDYTATFRHTDKLGDPRLSRIKSVGIRELIHTVEAYGTFHDHTPDFLVNDLPDMGDTADTLYLSDGSIASVGLADGVVTDGDVLPTDLEIQLTAEMSEGWCYLRRKGGDPGGADYRLVRVVRSDGVELPTSNFWQTDRTFIEQGRRPIYEDSLHLLDHHELAGTYSYKLVYEKRDQVGPIVTDIELPNESPLTEPIASLDVRFNEPIDPASFNWQDVVLSREGGLNLVDDSVTIEHLSGSLYQISGLESLTGLDGQYELTIHADGVDDLFDNAGSGAKTLTWIKATDAPTVLALGGLSGSVVNAPVDWIDVRFSQPISAGTFTAEDVVLLRNDGQNLVDSGITVTQTDVQTYRIGGLAGLTEPEGSYHLTVSAEGVTDLAGNAGIGQRSLVWSMDTTGPTVASLSGLSSTATNSPIDNLSVVFSEAVDPTTVSADSLTLTRDGGLNLITGAVTLVPLGGSVYRITGLAALASVDGDYVLTVNASCVHDLVGNAGSGAITPMDAGHGRPAAGL